MAKLGELYKITSGGTPSRTHSEYYEDGTIPWVKTGDLKDKYLFETDEKISQLGLENSSARIYLKNTVLLAMYGATIGATSILKIDAATNQACAAFSPREDTLPEYLCAFLESQKDKFIKDAVGGAQPNLSAGYLKTIEFKLPSLEQQTRITRNLSKIDELLLLRKQQIAKLDELVKARFVEMFGSYPENENAYPVVNVSDIADAGVGVVIKPAQYYVTEERGIKAFRSLNIGEMYIKDSDWVYFSTEGNESNKKSQLHENDLLIVRSGAPGTSCVVTKEFEGCNAVDVIIAHPDLSKVNPWYLCAYINYPHGKKQIEEGTGGAAQQHFNVGKCNNLKVLLPPRESQNQFADFVERVSQQKQTVQQSLEKLELMKKALMQEYFG